MDGRRPTAVAATAVAARSCTAGGMVVARGGMRCSVRVGHRSKRSPHNGLRGERRSMSGGGGGPVYSERSGPGREAGGRGRVCTSETAR